MPLVITRNYPASVQYDKPWAPQGQQTWWRGLSGEAAGQTELHTNANLVPLIHGCDLVLMCQEVSGDWDDIDIDIIGLTEDLENPGTFYESGASRIGPGTGAITTLTSDLVTAGRYDTDNRAHDWASTHIRPHITTVSTLASVIDIGINQVPATYIGRVR